MVKTECQNLKKIIDSDLENVDLIVEMLKYEEALTRSDIGQTMYKNKFNKSITSLFVEKALNRMTLFNFGFNTSDENVEMYRTIYKKHKDNKLVTDSVYYMRNNKCLWYKMPLLTLGYTILNCNLFDKSQKLTSLFDIYSETKSEYMVLTPFSLT